MIDARSHWSGRVQTRPRTISRTDHVQLAVIRFGQGAAVRGHPSRKGVRYFFVRMPLRQHRLSVTILENTYKI